MKYDTTGPVTVNETKSLLALISLVGLVVAGIGLGILFGRSQGRPEAVPATTQSASATRTGATADGVTRVNDNLTVVRAGDVVVEIRQNDENVWVSRGAPRDNPDAAERWQLARVMEAIARNPEVAKRYDAAAVADKLKGLDLRPPQLTAYQRDQVRDLYLAAEDVKGPARVGAEQVLVDAVRGMGIPPAERGAFDAAVERGRALLTPAQLELIRTGGRHEPPAKSAMRPAEHATAHPASRPARNPAKATTHPTRRALPAASQPDR